MNIRNRRGIYAQPYVWVFWIQVLLDFTRPHRKWMYVALLIPGGPYIGHPFLKQLPAGNIQHAISKPAGHAA